MVAHWWFASRSERVCCEEHSRDIWFAADREAAIEGRSHWLCFSDVSWSVDDTHDLCTTTTGGGYKSPHPRYCILRVCSGPQRVSDQAEILTEPSIFEISPYSIILGQPTSYTHIRRSLRTSSPPHIHHQSDSVYRNGNQSFPPRAEQYDSTFLIFKVTFAVPAPWLQNPSLWDTCQESP